MYSRPAVACLLGAGDEARSGGAEDRRSGAGRPGGDRVLRRRHLVRAGMSGPTVVGSALGPTAGRRERDNYQSVVLTTGTGFSDALLDPGRETAVVIRGPRAGAGSKPSTGRSHNLPAVVPVEWLNTTCTLYRREALPAPVFPPHFTGYSMCEDLTLSLTVGKKWKLANARTARIFHDSQPGEHKRSFIRLAAMELVNRHYVMSQVLGRRRVFDYARLVAWEAFQVVASGQGGAKRIFAEILGKMQGAGEVVLGELL